MGATDHLLKLLATAEIRWERWRCGHGVASYWSACLGCGLAQGSGVSVWAAGSKGLWDPFQFIDPLPII
ncbi:hypothetical protein Tco_0770057 [Tanacetum coccineum]|uniref:Uncharacterized protein n=1 Tax=Tanacetum coccineum TaxID=301880 RepID=A0ABQ4ZDQ1_9ASTR